MPLSIVSKTAAHVAWRSCSVLVLSIAALLCVSMSAATGQAPKTFAPGDESPEEFRDGAGRDETFYLCTACHNFKLVAAQGLNRRQWEESFELMISKHGMAKIEGKDRELVLDYLEKSYPPRAPSGGVWQNPFLRK